jgi:hypothetical protein
MLTGVKLRKTVTHDTSGPRVTGIASDADVREYEDRFLACNIENWVGLLGDELTFRTLLVDLSADDAAAMLAMCETRFGGDGETWRKIGALEQRL